MNPLMLIMMVAPSLIQGIASIFHKDDPAKPTVQPEQAPQMFMQSLLPMIMFMSMSKDDSNNNMLPMIMMMQMMGVNPTQALTPTVNTAQDTMKAITDMQNQMKALAELMAAMEKKT